MSAVGSDGMNSVGSPNAVSALPRPLTIRSSVPDARNTPIATRIAMRYGMIRMATLKPSFAPSMKAS
jgi:hypothetical protein